MRSSLSLPESLRLLCREASRSPWICLSALRRATEEPLEGDAATGGQPVLVLGGFLSPPFYYAPLGRSLTRHGYRVHFDDVVNVQPLRRHIARLTARAEAIADASGSALRIVGHSLGGIQAMVLMLERPALVAQVVAVASPVAGGTPWQPLQRLVERVLGVRARETRVLERRIAAYASRITTISLPRDRDLVAPPETCSVEGATNVVLTTLPRSDRALASHGGVVFMRAAVRAIVAALERRHAAVPPRRAAG